MLYHYMVNNSCYIHYCAQVQCLYYYKIVIVKYLLLFTCYLLLCIVNMYKGIIMCCVYTKLWKCCLFMCNCFASLSFTCFCFCQILIFIYMKINIIIYKRLCFVFHWANKMWVWIFSIRIYMYAWEGLQEN